MLSELLGAESDSIFAQAIEKTLSLEDARVNISLELRVDSDIVRVSFSLRSE